MKQLLKLPLEIGPIAIFFVVNNYYDIFVATQVFMIAVPISLVVTWLLFRKIAVMPLVTCFFVLVFGGLTIYWKNPIFIKMKPTIINGLFFITLMGGYYYRMYFMKIVFEDAFRLSDEGWRIMTYRWAFFFLFLAVLNEVVWRGANYIYLTDPALSGLDLKTAEKAADDFWVSFKTFGVMPITMIFGMSQMGVIQKYSLDSNDSDDDGVKSTP